MRQRGRRSMRAALAILVLALTWPFAVSAATVHFVGSEGYSDFGPIALLDADEIHNFDATGTSGPLRLELWASPLPFSGSFAGGYRLATYGLPPLAAGASLTNVASGVVTFTPPPSGLWYVALVLTEQTGAPVNGGYSVDHYANFAQRISGTGAPPPPPDTTAPTVGIASPTAGTVSGTVTVSANASDNVGVTRVDFYVNGSLAGSDSATPYQYSWNTTSVANGTATLRAIAYDAAGNAGQSSLVSVTVANGPPPDRTPPTVRIVSPAAGKVAGSITITADASDNVGVVRVDFYVNGSLIATDNAPPWQASWNTTKAADGTATVLAVAYDAAGNSGTSASVQMEVFNPGSPPPPVDSTPPTAAIASPTGGSVSGVVPVVVNASDDVGVARVDLFANGHVVASRTSAPWQFAWNSAGVADGGAQLQAVAYDAAGNAGTSPAVMVKVANAGSPTQITAYAVEYYDATLDHYFMTAAQSDIDVLDSGAIAGWVRTGYAFKVYAQPVDGASPVCRIYIPPGYGDSHFFSASPAECAEAIEQNPSFVYETADAFYIDTPDSSGNCPAGDAPIYRLWNHRPDINHRYTTSWDIRQQMVAQGYIAEGYGPNAVMMCSPP
jgi:Bacterial Ig domain/Repeat of unknown function (DUF5648)